MIAELVNFEDFTFSHENNFIGCSFINNTYRSLLTFRDSIQTTRVGLYQCSFPSKFGTSSGVPIYIARDNATASGIPNVFSDGNSCLTTDVLIKESTSGIISNKPIEFNLYENGWGSAESVDGIWRYNGAGDGIRNYSWKIRHGNVDVFSSGYTEGFRTPMLTKFINPGSGTITLYIASDITFYDNEVYLIAFSPSENNPPTSQYRYINTQRHILSPSSPLTSDNSNWYGNGVSVKQKLSTVIAPTISGILQVALVVAKSGVVLYLDPNIYSP